MRVVHAHSWVVIDCRIPQESVIRIVSTMGTKESISYKMISHGSWYRQIQRKREEEQQPRRGEERKGEGKQQPSQEKDTEEGSTQEKKEKCKHV